MRLHNRCFEIHTPSTVTVRLRDDGPGAAVGVSSNQRDEFPPTYISRSPHLQLSHSFVSTLLIVCLPHYPLSKPSLCSPPASPAPPSRVPPPLPSAPLPQPHHLHPANTKSLWSAQAQLGFPLGTNCSTQTVSVLLILPLSTLRNGIITNLAGRLSAVDSRPSKS